jgi:uncharacterized membrane protein YgcG
MTSVAIATTTTTTPLSAAPSSSSSASSSSSPMDTSTNVATTNHGNDKKSVAVLDEAKTQETKNTNVHQWTLSGYPFRTAWRQLHKNLLLHKEEESFFWAAQVQTSFDSKSAAFSCLDYLIYFIQSYCSLTSPELTEFAFKVLQLIHEVHVNSIPVQQVLFAQILHHVVLVPKSNLLRDAVDTCNLLSSATSFFPTLEGATASESFLALPWVAKLQQNSMSKSNMAPEMLLLNDSSSLIQNMFVLIEWWYNTVTAVMERVITNGTPFKSLRDAEKEFKIDWLKVSEEINTTCDWKEGPLALQHTELHWLLCGTIIEKIAHRLRSDTNDITMPKMMWIVLKYVVEAQTKQADAKGDVNKVAAITVLRTRIFKNLDAYNAGLAKRGDPFHAWMATLLLISRYPSTVAPSTFTTTLDLNAIVPSPPVQRLWNEVLHLNDKSTKLTEKLILQSRQLSVNSDYFDYLTEFAEFDAKQDMTQNLSAWAADLSIDEDRKLTNVLPLNWDVKEREKSHPLHQGIKGTARCTKEFSRCTIDRVDEVKVGFDIPKEFILNEYFALMSTLLFNKKSPWFEIETNASLILFDKALKVVEPRWKTFYSSWMAIKEMHRRREQQKKEELAASQKRKTKGQKRQRSNDKNSDDDSDDDSDDNSRHGKSGKKGSKNKNKKRKTNKKKNKGSDDDDDISDSDNNEDMKDCPLSLPNFLLQNQNVSIDPDVDLEDYSIPSFLTVSGGRGGRGGSGRGRGGGSGKRGGKGSGGRGSSSSSKKGKNNEKDKKIKDETPEFESVSELLKLKPLNHLKLTPMPKELLHLSRSSKHSCYIPEFEVVLVDIESEGFKSELKAELKSNLNFTSSSDNKTDNKNKTDILWIAGPFNWNKSKDRKRFSRRCLAHPTFHKLNVPLPSPLAVMHDPDNKDLLYIIYPHLGQESKAREAIQAALHDKKAVTHEKTGLVELQAENLNIFSLALMLSRFAVKKISDEFPDWMFTSMMMALLIKATHSYMGGDANFEKLLAAKHRKNGYVLIADIQDLPTLEPDWEQFVEEAQELFKKVDFPPSSNKKANTKSLWMYMKEVCKKITDIKKEIDVEKLRTYMEPIWKVIFVKKSPTKGVITRILSKFKSKDVANELLLQICHALDDDSEDVSNS